MVSSSFAAKPQLGTLNPRKTGDVIDKLVIHSAIPSSLFAGSFSWKPGALTGRAEALFVGLCDTKLELNWL
jgi:hypothetical protein